jgi:hypothetical protein
MPNEMDSTQIHKAMRDRLPVVYEGHRYDRITEYVAWYDSNQKLQLSVVLLSGNYTIRVLANKVVLWKGVTA